MFFNAGLSATETLVLVQRNEAVNRLKVFGWYSRFRDGREIVEDDESGGRPKSTRTDRTVYVRGDYLCLTNGQLLL
jgi:hypothetical protein